MALAANAAYSLLQARAKPTPLKANYNPTMTSPAMAQASAYGRVVAPPRTSAATAPAPPPVSPPSDTSSQQSAASAGGLPPGEGVYGQDSAAAYDAFNAANAAADKESANAKLQYGMNAEGSNLDPYNSTGLIQQLMHQQSQTSMADAENALGNGLGSTGLGAQQAEQHDFGNQADLSNTMQGYQALLAQALGHKSDASTTLQNTLLAARQRQIEMDIQNQMFQAWAASQSGGDGGGDQGPPVTDNTPSPVDHTPDALARYLANAPVLSKPKAKSTTSGLYRGVR